MVADNSANDAANYEDDEADNQHKPAGTCSCDACNQSTDYKNRTDSFPSPACSYYADRNIVATLTCVCAAKGSTTVRAGGCLV